MIIRVEIPDDKPRTEEENRLRKGFLQEGYKKRSLLGLLNLHSTDEDLRITPEDETKTGS